MQVFTIMFLGYIMSQFNDQLSVGLLGQLVRPLPGIREVKVQIPAEGGGMAKCLELWTCPY